MAYSAFFSVFLPPLAHGCLGSHGTPTVRTYVPRCQPVLRHALCALDIADPAAKATLTYQRRPLVPC